MDKQGTLLIVDDNKSILKALRILLEKYFARVITIASPNLIPSKLREESIDLILLDMNFSAGINNGNEGIYWLSQIKKSNPGIQVVLITAYADIDLAVRAIKDGASDFIVKPWTNEKLVATLLSAYNLGRSKQEISYLKKVKRELSAETSMYWGESEAMAHIKALVHKVAATDANILITGENGTGKEILANEIHRLSSRASALMVTVDMGALTESLFESELFGHVKGAFTDAHSDRIGKFEIARGGTLFLDEIGNLSYRLQGKLLSAIQSHSIVRVGSNKPIPTDIRLICATNRNLLAMVSQEAFRKDLLYRINTIHIEIPPLRNRRADILPLAMQFLHKYATRYHKPGMGIDDDAAKKLRDYAWYGNIRELQHTIEKAVIITESAHITAKSLQISPSIGQEDSDHVSTLEEMEKKMIKTAMRVHENNMSAVASQLGITRQTLYNKIKKYNL